VAGYRAGGLRHQARHSRASLATLGLCYPDFSGKNVLVDPFAGLTVLIDCDSLTVPGRLSATVDGSPDFARLSWSRNRSSCLRLRLIGMLWLCCFIVGCSTASFDW